LKWDAVLRELSRRGWQPKSERLHDWGCGTAIASRRVVRHWPHFRAVSLYDRSSLAVGFGAQRLSEEAPQVHIDSDGTIGPDALLLVSHVLNELSPTMLSELLANARHAREIIWVEAGTHAESRALIDLREQLLGTGLFVAVAPCTPPKPVRATECGKRAPLVPSFFPTFRSVPGFALGRIRSRAGNRSAQSPL
jgi:hypothetical protein